MRVIRIVLCLMLVLFLFTSTAHALNYQFIDLGTLGGPNSQARAINNLGQIVGQAQYAPGQKERAFIWNPGGTMQDLGTMPGYEDRQYSAYDINDNGTIVGRRSEGSGWPYSTFLISSPGAALVDPMPGWVATPNAINASGQFVGAGGSWMSDWQGFLKNSGQPVIDLGGIGGTGSPGGAVGINDSGQIVGHSWDPSHSYYHALLWDGVGGMQDLGTLPGHTNSEANDINNLGQIVGSSGHAFLLNPGQSVQDLGTLGGSQCAAYRINNLGQIVGWSYVNGDGAYHAFVVEPGGMIQDLNSLAVGLPTGVNLDFATDINDNGWIVGYTSGAYQHAFLLTPMTEPVPEPATMLLLGSGLVGLAGFRKRFRKS